MVKKFQSDTPTIEEIRRLKKPNEVTVPIILEPSAKHALEDKYKEIERARRNFGKRDLADKTVPKLEEELEALEASLEDVTVNFLMRDIGRKNYDNLVDAYPPSDEQKAEYKKQMEEREIDLAKVGPLEYDPEMFPAALIAACCQQPKMTVEQAKELVDEWSDGDVEALFMGALQACKERTSVGFTRPAIEKTEDSEPNSTSALSGD